MELPPRPASLRRLQEIKESNEYEFWAWGTHSILDMDRVVPADADAEAEHGAVRVLSAAEVRDLLGSERPTAHDSEAMDPGDDLDPGAGGHGRGLNAIGCGDISPIGVSALATGWPLVASQVRAG